ncbi:MAG: putative bifunctional diguanylate cyclase/phosphodiesterase, partial [Pseudonocardiaceae bacterium]
FVSPSATRVFGYDPSQLVGHQLSNLLHPDDRERAAAFFRDAARTPDVTGPVEWSFRQPDGSWLHAEILATNLLRDPTVRGIVLNTRDISERKRLEEQLTHQAFHDPLTGLANRALFRDRVSHALALAQRQGHPITVLFLDLDDFKKVNDSLGHSEGDRLLIAAAERFLCCARAADTVARLGGDEFAVLCEDVGDRSEVTALADRLGAALRSPFEVRGASVVTNASIGIAFTDRGDVTADALIADADAAMYRAKAVRGDRYVIFDEAMRKEDRERLGIETALRSALPRDELHLVYQPIVALPDRAIAAVEVLLRWRHPERAEISPAQFIPAAEQTGLIVPIGRWVLEQACREATGWPSTGPAGAPTLCVNLSSRQFGQADLVEMVEEVLDDTGLEPRRLALELTESALMEELDDPLETLHGLKRQGVRLVLDDFGTGYSSLSYLQRFPIDTLKADRSFVAALGEGGEGDSAVLAAVAMLAHAIDVEVVGEGSRRRSSCGRSTSWDTTSRKASTWPGRSRASSCAPCWRARPGGRRRRPCRWRPRAESVRLAGAGTPACDGGAGEEAGGRGLVRIREGPLVGALVGVVGRSLVVVLDRSLVVALLLGCLLRG